MKKIIHFHPNGKYSNKFILPLQHFESCLGYRSIIINDKNAANKTSQVDYVIKKNNFFKFPLIFITLILFIYRSKPDIIICHNSTVSWFPILVSRLLFVKNIIYFNHGIPYLGYQGVLRLILYVFEKFNCLLATKIITVSKAMKSELENITKKSVSLIHNGSASGIDLKQFIKSKRNILKLKEQYNIYPNNKIILFVGRPNRRKGFYDIMEIWRKYFVFRSDYTLVLLGISERDVKKLYKKIPNNIMAMSFVENPEPFFMMADYLFMNSYHEGLNYSVLESMLSKTIVISNKFLGVSELIIDNFNGFLVKNNNHRSFFNTVILCEESKVLKNKIIKNGFFSLKKYDRKYFLKNYRFFLESL